MAEHARAADGSRHKLLDGQGWFDTGDLGWLDGQGRLHILGRGDDMLISGGENIHPVLLEKALRHCPEVEDVAVSAVADSAWGDRLIVLYCGSATVDQVRAWAKQHLQGAFLPRHFFRMESLPRNSMGKLLRSKVKRQAMDRFL